jgi:hypothetical protein
MLLSCMTSLSVHDSFHGVCILKVVNSLQCTIVVVNQASMLDCNKFLQCTDPKYTNRKYN